MSERKKLLLAFEKVEYRVPSLQTSFRCHEKPDDIHSYMIERGFSSFTFITAYNPLGIYQSKKENRQLTLQLLEGIKKYSHHFCQTYIGASLDETGFVVYDLPHETGIALQIKFQQVAIVCYTSLGVPALGVNEQFLSQNLSHPKRRA